MKKIILSKPDGAWRAVQAVDEAGRTITLFGVWREKWPTGVEYVNDTISRRYSSLDEVKAHARMILAERS